MKVDVLVAEIGSTTTVVNAFDGIHNGAPLFVGQGQANTTVTDGDVRIGLEQAILDLKKNLGEDALTYDELFATSSAAGGLKMTVHGLVFDMTARAAREAALGAGAVLHMVTAGKLRRTDLQKIRDIHPNLILIAGGVDYGERDTAIYNSELIAGLGTKIPVIYAGNVENQEEVRLIFGDTGQDLFIVENVYPKIDDLNIEPTRKVIQEAFEKHIREAPGMEHIYDVVSENVIPTPGSVMNMTRLLYEKIGSLLVIDVGGATTDVHSVADDTEAVAQILVSPEPKAKRTVEGDLGLFVNLDNVVELFGEDRIQEEGFDLEAIHREYTGIPSTDEERRFILRMTEIAAATALQRHAGKLRYVYGPSGRTTLAEGKDLTSVRTIIGTGGALSQLAGAKEILKKLVLLDSDDATVKLLPRGNGVTILLDRDYIMASLGVLSMKYPEAALQLLEHSLDYTFV